MNVLLIFKSSSKKMFNFQIVRALSHFDIDPVLTLGELMDLLRL